MPFIIEVGAGGVPVGVYRARFVRVENYVNEDRPDYGAGYKFVWVILEGPHKDAEVSRITSGKFGAGANLPKVLKWFYGRDLKAGEQPDLEALYGVEGTVVVEETDSGATRVGSFVQDQGGTPPF